MSKEKIMSFEEFRKEALQLKEKLKEDDSKFKAELEKRLLELSEEKEEVRQEARKEMIREHRAKESDAINALRERYLSAAADNLDRSLRWKQLRIACIDPRDFYSCNAESLYQAKDITRDQIVDEMREQKKIQEQFATERFERSAERRRKELPKLDIAKAIKTAVAKADASSKLTKELGNGSSYFAQLPWPLLLHEKATPMDAKVYGFIRTSCVMNRRRWVEISQEKIANYLNTDQRIVSKSIKNLERLGWLKVRRRPKEKSLYCPEVTETPEAKATRIAAFKPKKKGHPTLKELFLKQEQEAEKEAEEARKNFIAWFNSLPEEEAEKFYQECSKEEQEDIAYIFNDDEWEKKK